MNKLNLGKLERVDLRDIWASESGNFTPWLAEEVNLALLGDTLGIDLQLEEQERGIGPFRADIVCKDTSDDSWVLIENQLELTDHTHLGQILTYAAGLGAVTVVWIAQRFTDEHRAALDWLNEISTDKIQFFGLEVEVWKIGDSPKAPKFNIVAKPNDWTKGGKGPVLDLTPAKQLQVDFWRGFREYVLSNGKNVKPTKALPQHWMNIAIGRSGFKLSAIASHYDSAGSGGKHELRAQLDIEDKKYAKVYYQLLEQQKDAIEKELEEDLIWYNPENARACRLYLRCNTDLHDVANRSEQYSWLLEKLEKLYKVFSSRVRLLDVPSERP